MQRFLFFLLTFPVTTLLFAQAGPLSEDNRATMVAQEAKLTELSLRMHTDSSAEARFTACNLLIKELVQTLKTPNSYRYDFSGLEGVSVRESPAGDFRFFSWELHVNRDEYRHYGAIQFNESDLRLLPLIDRGAALRQNPETALTTNADWLGYVIYDVLPAGTRGGRPYYFLFGFDRYAATSRQKILDVFYLDDGGKPHFGAPVFDTYTESGELFADRHRIVLEYHAAASVTLRYEPESQRIIYENLIVSRGDDGGPINLPDGSYHALEYGRDGRWHEVSKVFDHVYESAPVPAPKAKETVDIMGKTRN